jgi:predicted N-formylglutamate amidohydrolase
MRPTILITCEHAGNEIPEEYKSLFIGREDVLQSHRGWDPGALEVASFMAEGLGCTIFSCEFTRLLIEPNRSIDSPQLFSEFSIALPAGEKIILIDDIYLSYRHAIEQEISASAKPVIHISVHSFTPVFNDVMREVDIGLLFDPARKMESAFCSGWRNNLVKSLPDKKIKFNEPYHGTDDGFTTYLRTKFSDINYAGIEIEINQKYASDNELLRIQSALLETLPVDFY